MGGRETVGRGRGKQILGGVGERERWGVGEREGGSGRERGGMGVYECGRAEEGNSVWENETGRERDSGEWNTEREQEMGRGTEGEWDSVCVREREGGVGQRESVED